MVWCYSRARSVVRKNYRSSYRVTELAPSKIAQHVSKAASATKAVLIDCFAGVGGNTIAFARLDRWTRVYAIEKDPHALACAKHNARLYGVHNKISWYLGDCFDIVPGQLRDLHQHAVLFASPPWGGRLGVDHMVRSLSCNG